MANPVTSGTATYLITRDQVINSVMRALKVIGSGQTAGGEDINNCSEALNLILPFLNTMGILQWCYQSVIFPFVAGQITYTIAETGANITNFRPVKIAHAWRRDSSTYPQDTPMGPLTRDDYDKLPTKTIPGVPVNWYYDPQIGLASVTVWPAPMDSTYSMGVAIQRPIQDILASNQNFDLEREWFLPIKWLLAEEVSSEYRVDQETLAMVAGKARMMREWAANFSQEDGPISIVPNAQFSYQNNRFST